MVRNEDGDPLDKILGKIGSRVDFAYSRHSLQGRVRGVLLDRVAQQSWGITRPEQFFNVIDLIEFEADGNKKHVIRFGYYVYRNGRLSWANRSLTDPVGELQKLFTLACERQGPDGRFWFREFIEGCRGD